MEVGMEGDREGKSGRSEGQRRDGEGKEGGESGESRGRQAATRPA